GDVAPLDAAVARAVVVEGGQVARVIVLGGVAIGPVGAAYRLRRVEDAVAGERSFRSTREELVEHLFRFAEEEEVGELGQRLRIEEGGRTARDDERRVRAALA